MLFMSLIVVSLVWDFVVCVSSPGGRDRRGRDSAGGGPDAHGSASAVGARGAGQERAVRAYSSTYTPFRPSPLSICGRVTMETNERISKYNQEVLCS